MKDYIVSYTELHEVKVSVYVTAGNEGDAILKAAESRNNDGEGDEEFVCTYSSELKSVEINE